VCVFDRNKRWRQPNHCVVVRTGVHAESVQLVGAGQPSWPRHRRRRRSRRRRTPSDAAHEPDADKPTARAHTDHLHGRSDEPHFSRLLPAPTNASAVLHVVLIIPDDLPRSHNFSPFSSIWKIALPPKTHNPQPATFTYKLRRTAHISIDTIAFSKIAFSFWKFSILCSL